MSKRFDGQPYSDNYLKRPPKNKCLTCGNNIKVRPAGRWHFMTYNEKIIGYTHLDCGDDNRAWQD